MDAMLTKRGHRVLSAANTEDALRIVEYDRPLLILSDIDLTTLGWLVEQLQARKNLEALPVVVVDGNHPESPHADVKVLHNYDELEDLIQSVAAEQ